MSIVLAVLTVYVFFLGLAAFADQVRRLVRWAIDTVRHDGP